MQSVELVCRPAYRNYAPFLTKIAQRHKDVTYLNISPAPWTWPIIRSIISPTSCSTPWASDGVYARTALYEGVVEKLAALITSNREAGTEVMRFPPVMSRSQLEKSGYLKSFPNLLGCVCGLHGTEREINAAVSRFDAGGDWTSSLSPADLVLSPAACYPVYPIAASRGQLPKGGLRFDVAADCFRREPSKHLDRLQSFRMREYVCIGTPDDVSDFRDRWMVRAQAIATDLGLTFRVDYASDPFFGRVGQMKAVSQKQQQLKFELADPAALGRAADRLHELQLSPRTFRHDLGHPGRQWRARAYRLRRLRHGSPGCRDVPHPRHRSLRLARQGAGPPGHAAASRG